MGSAYGEIVMTTAGTVRTPTNTAASALVPQSDGNENSFVAPLDLQPNLEHAREGWVVVVVDAVDALEVLATGCQSAPVSPGRGLSGAGTTVTTSLDTIVLVVTWPPEYITLVVVHLPPPQVVYEEWK